MNFIIGEIHQYLFQNNTIFFIIKENEDITKKIALCKNVSVENDAEDIFEYNSNTKELRLSFTIQTNKFSKTYTLGK